MDRIAGPSNLQQLLPGTVLRVPRGLYDHVVILGEHTWATERQVLSFGPGAQGLTEIPYSRFGGTNTVKVDGYLGQLDPFEVLARARRIGGQQRYSWIDFNCEHFVRASHGLPAESPQVAFAAVIAFGALLLRMAS
ncbi:hypothetical protein FN976_11480 [Caenimonas sedimenti]|uniref:LRAT domain-containing protein n=1 Tax=Caenimonas sedimenti TaxID=2596921 RepID=A0A562ZT63_9BURK|nr:lecithin retinol acyltransferase family protein [Caenimonas sedimenti]TWO71528.1 hypothetical protein FN976_11480 [Caenimonas sedimenti]